MKKFVLFLLFVQFAATALCQTKQVMVEGHGTPVVLLNGGQFDMTALTEHSRLLADSFTVIRMQQFNTQYAAEGRMLPANYSVATESEAIGSTLDSLHITAPIILAGHSYGGVIAFDFALHHPDRIRSLILVEAPLYDLARMKGLLSEEMKGIDSLTLQFTPAATVTEDMVKAFRCKLMNCDSINIYQHPMWNRWIKNKDRLKGLSAVPGYKVNLKMLHDFRQPVLIVTGSTTIAANKTVDQLLLGEFPHATPGSLPGDHAAIYQNAPAFVRLISEFMQNGR